MRIATTFRGLVSKISSFFGRTGYGFSWLTLGANRHWDYSKEAGVRYDNSVVAAAVQWAQRRLSEARMIVERKGQNGIWIEVPEHALPLAVQQGVAYDGNTLLCGMLLSLVCTGNAFLYKVRARSGDVIGYLLMDYSRTEPKNDLYLDAKNPYQLITYYKFRDPFGQEFHIPPSDVVHLRFGLNPANHMLGMSPIAGALAEVVTDNEAAMLGLSLLRNGGIPSVAFEPSEKISDDLTPGQKAELEERIKSRVAGPGAGRPIIMPIPGQWKVIGFEPDKLTLNDTRAMAVSRILSGLGIDPMVLGFPSEQKTYSNYQEAHEAAVENCLLPLLKLIADAFTTQSLRTDFFTKEVRIQYRVGWDLSEVRALQPDLTAIWERVGKAWERNLVTRKEAREEMGMKASTGDDVYYSDVSGGAIEPTPEETPVAKSLARKRLAKLAQS
ncbi:MAG: phage portal protein [Desulfurellales bacterium]|nr:MAG: phage portal protein [Desulfurellales bacterium]